MEDFQDEDSFYSVELGMFAVGQGKFQSLEMILTKRRKRPGGACACVLHPYALAAEVMLVEWG